MTGLTSFDHLAAQPWLSFTLDGQHYAVLLNQVSEVIRDHAPTPVPGAAPDLLGICHLRGNIVPVMDGVRRLGLQGRHAVDPAQARIVVLASGAHRIGLRVDAVGDLLQPERDAIALPPAQSSREDDPVLAVMAWREGFVALLEVGRLCRLEAQAA